jgi:hypothetical protein
VWQSSEDWSYTSYWLQDDGTAWSFDVSTSSFWFYKTSWSTSQISGQEVTFNNDKTQFTPSYGGSAYTKTTETKPPAAATGNLLGHWVNEDGGSIELKNDGNAVLKAGGSSITLKYRAEANAVYLLTPTGDLVIASITVSDDKLAGLSKLVTDPALAGIWKLTKDGQDYYWNLKADGSGTFHALGASVPFSFTVTDDGNKRIDDRPYTVSGETLEFPGRGLTLTKVASVLSGSGADGDSRLHGTWNMTQGGMTITFTFKSDGVLVQSRGGESESSIWKADGKKFYLYQPYFDSYQGDGDRDISYNVSASGSTFTVVEGMNEIEFTKQ